MDICQKCSNPIAMCNCVCETCNVDSTEYNLHFCGSDDAEESILGLKFLCPRCCLNAKDHYFSVVNDVSNQDKKYKFKDIIKECVSFMQQNIQHNINAKIKLNTLHADIVKSCLEVDPSFKCQCGCMD